METHSRNTLIITIIIIIIVCLFSPSAPEGPGDAEELALLRADSSSLPQPEGDSESIRRSLPDVSLSSASEACSDKSESWDSSLVWWFGRSCKTKVDSGD